MTPQYRDLIPDPPDDASDHASAITGRSFIAVIGINKYKHWKNLGNAVNDAVGIQNLFTEKFGFEAPFPPLLDLAATKQAINELVLDRLRQLLETGENLNLVLVFAGHGHTRINLVDQIETGFLIPTEARRDHWSDYVKINSFLEELSQLPVRHILLILDSCKSGIALGPAMEIDRGGLANYEQSMLKHRSRWVITSAKHDEPAIDSGPIPDHSLFTGTLIQGLQSKDADLDKNNIVTAKELGLYLEQTVSPSSKSRQTPNSGTFLLDAGGQMVISYRQEEVELHYQIGRRLYELGWILHDSGRFESAVRHYNQSVSLSPQPTAQLYFERGRAQQALKNYLEAIQDFQKALALENDFDEAQFHLGICLARQGDDEAAALALQSFLDRRPDDDRAAWTQGLINRLQVQETGSRYALLIGIDQHQNTNIQNLRGSINSVRAMQKVLIERYGFAEKNIAVVTDHEATRSGILRALDGLRQRTTADDAALVYYSGHSLAGDSLGYLVPHDGLYEAGNLENGIDAEELHERILSIPAAARVLVFDTHATRRFVNLAAEQSDYTLFLATSPANQAYERSFPVAGDRHIRMGVFTHAFVRQLERLPANAAAQEIMSGTVAEIEAPGQQFSSPQTPLLFGRKEWPLFDYSAEVYSYIEAFDFSLRRNFSALSRDRIVQDYVGAGRVPLPRLHFCYGRGLLDKGEYRRAAQAFQTAAEQKKERYSEANIGLGIALLRSQQYGEALAILQEEEEMFEDALQEPLVQMKQLQQNRRHALLIGIDDYGSDEYDSSGGAVNDVRAVESVLRDLYGFQDIKLLINGEATREAILSAFKDLVAYAAEEPAIFYFAGTGAVVNREPVIECALHGPDRANQIALRKLADMAGDAPTNLVSVFDAGWAPGLQLPWRESLGTRFYAQGSLNAARDFAAPPASGGSPETAVEKTRADVKEDLDNLKIGALSIFHVSIQAAFGITAERGGEAFIEDEFPAPDGGSEKVVHGALTYAIIECLRDSDPETLNYAELWWHVSRRLNWLRPYVVGINLEDIIFSNLIKEANVEDLLTRLVLKAPIKKTVMSLAQDLANLKDNTSPEDHVDLGIAFGELGNYDTAITNLRIAIEKGGDDYAEARFHHGRLLFESGANLDLTINELREAIKHGAHITPAYYYFGQAIRVRVEQESDALKEAQRSLQIYLDRGAPVGNQEEVRQFLYSGKRGSS